MNRKHQFILISLTTLIGAHASGFAGAELQNISRITGLGIMQHLN